MYIKKFRLLNYKSYIDPELLELLPGINIIVGQNNSGKTALLEALTLRLLNVPHRSVRSLPTAFSKLSSESSAEVVIVLEKTELHSLLEQLPQPLGLLIPSNPGSQGNGENFSSWWDGEPQQAEQLGEYFNRWLARTDSIELNLSLSGDSADSIQIPITGFFDSKNVINSSRIIDQDEMFTYLAFYLGEDGTIKIKLQYDIINNPFEEELVGFDTFEANYKASISYRIFDLFRDRIYRFYAERLNVSTCSLEGKFNLKPDASNLAEVLNTLPNRDPASYTRLNSLISEVFPSISYISSINTHDRVVEIRVWTLETTNASRDDLSMCLSVCGTGISQVLAILYVVVTSRFPRVIIIDELQSFLHPGAARKLVEILKQFPQHQYIVATHSPMLITASNSSQIIKLSHNGIYTTVLTIRSTEIAEQKSIMAELGVRLSDVFGADDILWVEGKTEEICFPRILERVAKVSLGGTVILSVQTTGQLDGKNARQIFDIYDRLSGGQFLFPPSIGFLLDQEGKSKQQQDDFKRRSPNLIEFLPRRMYENYLLVPEAIASVINALDQDKKVDVTLQEVQQWLEEKKQEKNI